MTTYASYIHDNRSTTTKVYEILSTAADVTLFLCRLIFYIFHGIYKLAFPPNEQNVAGEIVLITGTGHGIGKELAKQYGELGSVVICVDVNPTTNESTARELKKLGIKVHTYTCDVRSRENVLQMAEKIQKEVGDVSILINNAGIMPCKKFLAHQPEEIKRIFDVNVFAHFWTLEAFLPGMIKNNHGHIVGISSIAGLLGSPHVVPYSASKFAVRGLMEGLSEEFRTRSTCNNIHFTTIFPYMTDTGLCKKPNIKFTNFMKMLSPSETARLIVRAQRRRYPEATAPEYLIYTNNFTRLLPRNCAKTVIDFLDAKLEEVQ
ncbi:hypothetical protein RUM44_002467 [Polyplax serrata]|uniref:Uncharacterized protein n=1 Tax=Polyplax serrata TaxID=468196 RepID=A0ABR1AEU7_POLSC